MSRRLEVVLHGTPVGEISETPEGGSEFRFFDDYFELVPRPVLGQKFEDDLERMHRSRARSRLPDFFANLVPEGRLRELIEQTTRVGAGDDLALLAYVGADLPGAVVVRPYEGEELLSEAPPAEEHGQSGEPDRSEGNGLRFSLAGVKSFGEIDRQTFERLVDRAGVDRKRIERLVGETLDRLRDTWSELGEELPLVPSHRQAIREHWRRVPLLRSVGELP